MSLNRKFTPDPKPEKKVKQKMTTWEYKKHLNNRAVKKNKYNSRRQTYNGYSYDSILEAEYAKRLDLLIKAGEVKSWTRQHRFDLRVNGKHWRYYKIDFRVVKSDGYIEYVEVKGFPTNEWKQKFDVTKIIFSELTKGEKARLYLNDKLIMETV